MFWDRETVLVDNLLILQFFLSVWVKLRETDQKFLLTTVYGPLEDRDKPSFLQ